MRLLKWKRYLVVGSLFSIALWGRVAGQSAVPEKAGSAQASLTLHFPRMVSNSGEWTGFAIVNFGKAAANLTLTAYEGTGKLSATAAPGKNPTRLTLPAGQQYSAVAFQIFGDSLNTSGSWVQVVSDQSEVAGFFLTFDPELNTMDGTDVSDRLFTPLIFTESDNTEISLANPSETLSADAAIHFITNQGAEPLKAVSVTIPPKGRYRAVTPSLFPSDTLKEGGYYQVTSTLGLAGVQVQNTPRFNTWALQAVDGSSQGGARLLYSPQYVVGFGYRTSMTVVNLESAPAVVTLTWINDQGSVLGVPVSLILPAMGRKVITDPNLFQASVPNSGYVRVESDRRITGTVRFGDETGLMLQTSLPFVSTARREVIYSQVVQDATFFTGVAITNPNAEEATVVLSIYDVDGRIQGAGTEKIAPGARISKILNQVVPNLPAMGKGYFRVASTVPVFSFAVFGTQNFTVLSAVPPQPVTP